jgi:activator of HSP90 ATPase
MPVYIQIEQLFNTNNTTLLTKLCKFIYIKHTQKNPQKTRQNKKKKKKKTKPSVERVSSPG